MSAKRFVLVLCALVSSSLADPSARSADAVFSDRTTEAGINATHQPSALMEAGSNLISYLCSGGVVGDFNNDGFQDVFVVIGGKAPDQLYINNGDGTFSDEAAAWGVAIKHMGMAAAVGDYDNDGWLDIFVTSGGLDGTIPSPGKHRLYRNTGRSSFEQVASAAGVAFASPILCDGLGATFGDYDLDGNLDLFVSGWLVQSQGNRLFRNNGNGTFTDVTFAAGLSFPGVHGFSPRFADMDGDYYPELLLSGDYHTSRYFRNNKNGTFTNITTASGTGLDDNGMGSTVGDLDGDGALDWLVTSIFSLGNPESPGTGNKLYRSAGEHLFEEIAAASGVVNGNWGWGASACDIDHDGDLDLLQTNGWPFWPEFNNKPTRVWINDGSGVFVDAAATCGLWHTLQGRGLLTFDADNDGDRDVLIFAYKDHATFYRNDLPAGPTTHWIEIEFDTSAATRLVARGVGTRVRATVADRQLLRYLDGGCNYQSQDELSIHLGLGGSASIAELRFEWADGTTSVLRDVAADQRLTIVAGDRCDLNGDGLVNAADLGLLLGAWGPIDAGDPIDLTADGHVDAIDLAVLLANWSPASG
ncbi:MAG: VCBS repeat-containing protein [Phycisphaerales bacterium]|nr:VCBS repeat-containing protein [Phycisphaerales bacterium]